MNYRKPITEAGEIRCRLLFSCEGSVTIFSAVVLSSLLLFFSVLIDYARVAAFHKLSESTTRSGIRSVLSAYDSFLYNNYGLFGRGGTEGAQLFNEVLQANIEGKYDSLFQENKGIKLIQMKLEDTALNSSAFLGSHKVFKRQVLEEMKYKAPVDFTLDIVSKFVPIAGAMSETAVTVNLLEKLRKLYERREAHLNRVLQLQKQAAAAASGSDLNAIIPLRASGLAAGGERTVYAIAVEYAAYAAMAIQAEAAAGDGEIEYGAEVIAYEEKARSIAASLRKLTAEIHSRHEQLLREAESEWLAASELNDQMQLLIRQSQTNARDSSYDRVGRSELQDSGQPGEGPLPQEAAPSIEQIRQAADEMLREDSWFTSYKNELHEQGRVMASVLMEAGSFQSSSIASLSKPINAMIHEQLSEGAASLRLAYAVYEERYVSPGAIIESRRQAIEQEDVRAQLSEHEEQAGALWKQARTMLQGITAVPQLDEHKQQFAEVRERYTRNLRFNEAAAGDDEISGAGRADDAYGAAEEASALSGSLFSGMAGMLERSRDSLYTAEYVMDRYAYFAPQQLTDMLRGGEMTELSHALALNHQEAEYVLYGFHDPTANVAAAYGQLFTARLAVRTMEGLIASRTLGHPLVILSAAIVYGLEKTMEDMLAFADRGSAPLSKYLKVELAYTDYLRLFLLANPSDESKRLARMIAIIEHNCGATLAEVPSGVTGEARLSMTLWFIPGLTGALGRIGLLDGKVVGNRYETAQTLGWSY